MAKLLYVLTVILIALTITGCSVDKETAGPVSDQPEIAQDKPKKVAVQAESSVKREDFESYTGEIQPFLADIEKIAGDYEEIKQSSADGEIDDEEFSNRLYIDIAPTYVELLSTIGGISPPKPLRETHEKLINMLSENLEAMTEPVAAVEMGDSSKVTSANSLLSEARKIERDFIYDIEEIHSTFE